MKKRKLKGKIIIIIIIVKVQIQQQGSLGGHTGAQQQCSEAAVKP